MGGHVQQEAQISTCSCRALPLEARTFSEDAQISTCSCCLLSLEARTFSEEAQISRRHRSPLAVAPTTDGFWLCKARLRCGYASLMNLFALRRAFTGSESA